MKKSYNKWKIRLALSALLAILFVSGKCQNSSLNGVVIFIDSSANEFIPAGGIISLEWHYLALLKIDNHSNFCNEYIVCRIKKTLPLSCGVHYCFGIQKIIENKSGVEYSRVSENSANIDGVLELFSSDQLLRERDDYVFFLNSAEQQHRHRRK